MSGPVHLYISPHLDDAVFSAGGLIARQTASGQDVLVATMVTADPVRGATLSPLAKRYLQAWGNPASPFADRCIEDARAVQAVGARWNHAGLLDGTYRVSDAGRHFYQSMDDLFSGVPDPEDGRFVADVADTVRSLINTQRPVAIYTAATVGRHVDHVAVFKGVLQAVAETPVPLFLWEDIPYALGIYPPGNPDTVAAALARIGKTDAVPTLEAVDIEVRVRASALYSSQIDDLFDGEASMRRAMATYAASFGTGGTAERYWRVR